MIVTQVHVMGARFMEGRLHSLHQHFQNAPDFSSEAHFCIGILRK